MARTSCRRGLGWHRHYQLPTIAAGSSGSRSGKRAAGGVQKAAPNCVGILAKHVFRTLVGMGYYDVSRILLFLLATYTPVN